MKNTLILIFSLLYLFQFSMGQDAREIVRISEEKFKGDQSFSEMTVTTVRPKWTREMKMKAWSLGDDYSLVLIVAPSRDKGSAFLKREKEIYNWVPSIDRSIKLPPSMMSQSWMGTDFTNDDLVKQTSIIDDFEHKLEGEETIEGFNCWKISLTPKENTPVVWGKIVMWISQKEYFHLKQEFYDEDDYLINSMVFSNVKSLGGRMIPSVMEMIPEDEPGNKTIMEYTSMDFSPGLSSSFFSVQNMKKAR